MNATVVTPELSCRHVAMLRAVAAGRAELTGSRVPDLYVDGRCCTDHAAAVLLAAAGLVTTTMSPSGPCARVPACLTDAGRAVLAGCVDVPTRQAGCLAAEPLAGRVPSHPCDERVREYS